MRPPASLALAGGCLAATEAGCLAAGGTYHGDGIACVEAVCPGGCTWDFDFDGVVGISDFLTLLANWGTCP